MNLVLKKGLLEHVSEGGTVGGWCDDKGYSYVRVKQALLMDKDFAAGMEYAEGLRRQRSEDIFMDGVNSIARGDIRGLFGEDGELLPPGRWPLEALSLVKGITFNDVGGVKGVNFWSREAALRTLGKSLGLLEVKKEDRRMTTLVAKKLEALESR